MPRLLYWKLRFRCSVKRPAWSVEQLTRVSVACPHDGQNCFSILRVTVKQPWQRSTHVLTCVMRAKLALTRCRLMRRETFCMAKSDVRMAAWSVS